MRPKIGVAVIIEREGKVLLGKRKNAHGEGQWAFPGGHLEWMEPLEDCAIREVKEETGLDISDTVFQTITNDMFFDEQKHYITVFMKAGEVDGEPKLMEPNKCERWDWFEWDKMPEPLFLATKNYLEKK